MYVALDDATGSKGDGAVGETQMRVANTVPELAQPSSTPGSAPGAKVSRSMQEWSSALASALSPTPTWAESVTECVKRLTLCPTGFGSCFRGELGETKNTPFARYTPLGNTPRSTDLFLVDIGTAILFCKDELQVADTTVLHVLTLMLTACNFFALAGWCECL